MREPNFSSFIRQFDLLQETWVHDEIVLGGFKVSVLPTFKLKRLGPYQAGLVLLGSNEKGFEVLPLQSCKHLAQALTREKTGTPLCLSFFSFWG